jgi:MarR family transcriptional regulator, 2-MHQ and catechol-resistance regulon repressor
VDLAPNQRRTLRAFLRVVALVEPLQRQLATEYGISLGDLHAVRVLSRLGESPVSRYGAELGLARSTITNLVDRLERAGLVARVDCPTDRRVTLVRLTATGIQAAEAVAIVAESDVARRVLALDDTDQTALAGLLEQLLATPGQGNEPTEAIEPAPEDASGAAAGVAR